MHPRGGDWQWRRRNYCPGNVTVRALQHSCLPASMSYHMKRGAVATCATPVPTESVRLSITQPGASDRGYLAAGTARSLRPQSEIMRPAACLAGDLAATAVKLPILPQHNPSRLCSRSTFFCKLSPCRSFGESFFLLRLSCAARRLSLPSPISLRHRSVR